MSTKVAVKVRLLCVKQAKCFSEDLVKAKFQEIRRTKQYQWEEVVKTDNRPCTQGLFFPSERLIFFVSRKSTVILHQESIWNQVAADGGRHKGEEPGTKIKRKTTRRKAADWLTEIKWAWLTV